MERAIRDGGVLRLPPGFRFHPTDEELLQYLKRKTMSYPMPGSVISEFEVCKTDPWNLPGDGEQERYFFSTREVKYPNGSRSNRTTGSGYWKATGLDKQVVCSRSNHVVGAKKTLVFYCGKPPKGCKTDWVMHEYRLPSTCQRTPVSADENWVLCRIFLKKRKSINANGEAARNLTRVAPVPYDLNLVPANSASDYSGITELTIISESADHEEESSGSNCFIK